MISPKISNLSSFFLLLFYHYNINKSENIYIISIVPFRHRSIHHLKGFAQNFQINSTLYHHCISASQNCTGVKEHIKYIYSYLLHVTRSKFHYSCIKSRSFIMYIVRVTLCIYFTRKSDLIRKV